MFPGIISPCYLLISSLEAVVSNYEAKVGGLEHEIEAQKEEYEKKLLDFAARLDFSEDLRFTGLQVGGH